MADSISVSLPDHPVGMAYLSGNLPTDRCTNVYQACLIFHRQLITWSPSDRGTQWVWPLKRQSLIKGRVGHKMGNGKTGGPKLVVPPPPPSRQGKTFSPPLLKGGNLLRPHISMAKTLSSCVTTTSKPFVPPL